jgi:hypothetical protein
MNTNQKVLPTKTHWLAIIGLSILAAFSTISVRGGWVLFIFPLILYFFGRGRQKEDEGFKL